MDGLGRNFGLIHIGVWPEPRREDRTQKKNEINYDSKTIDGVPLRKLYIKNVPLGTKREQLYPFFTYFGDVENIEICRSQNQNRRLPRYAESRKVTFAFVTYKSSDDAIKALSSKFVQFGGKKLYISPAYAYCQPFTNYDSSEEDEPVDCDTSACSEGSLIGYKHNDEVPIENLDDYCLRHIFKYLPHTERIKIERVCRRWKTIARGMWHTEKELDLANNIPFAIPEQHRKLLVLQKIFKRCGSSLKKLNLQGVDIEGAPGLIEAIMGKCLQLEELRLQKQFLNTYKTNMLKPLKNLRVLSLEDCDPLNDTNLKSLLEDKLHLTHLEVTNSHHVNGSFLACINSPLETLNLSACEELTSDNLRANLGKFSSTLKHLYLANCQTLDMDDINDILSRVPELRTLMLSHYPHESMITLHGITALKHLESLHVAFNRNISEDFLRLLVQSKLELTCLDISGAGLDDEADEGSSFCFSRLNTMKSLRTLNLSYVSSLDGDILRKYASNSPPIESLSLCCCTDLEDDDIKSLFTSCHQLKHLDLSNCFRITEETIKAANEALSLRSNNQPLQLVVAGTSIKNPSQSNSNNESADSTNEQGGSQSESKAPPLHPSLTVSYESKVRGEPDWFRASSEDGFFHHLALDNWFHQIISEDQDEYFDSDDISDFYYEDSDEDTDDLDDALIDGFFF